MSKYKNKQLAVREGESDPMVAVAWSMAAVFAIGCIGLACLLSYL